jgi:putative chitinase
MTPDFLVRAVGCTSALAVTYAPHLTEACARYAINTPARVAAFLAQLGHESGSFRYAREIASGDAYEGRADLGNTQPGDGRRYKGRGLIQLTGRSNYERMTLWLGAAGVNPPRFIDYPDLLESPRWAAWSAAAYWHHNRLNALADAGEFIKLGRAINRGNANSSRPANGEADRLARWARAKSALPVESPPPAPVAAPEPKEAPVVAPLLVPFLSAAATAIAGAMPRLGELFAGESPTAQRNVQAATIAVQVARDALGAQNEQEIVERLANDPQAATVVSQALEANWYQLHEAAEKSVAAARVHAATYSQMKDVRTVVGGFTFIEMLSLILVISSLVGGVLMVLYGSLDDQLKGAIVTLMLIGGYTGVKDFWFGSSHGSKTKDGTGGSRS